MSAEAVGAFALAVALKASLVVAAGFLVAALLRRQSAALRHLVWSVALGAAAAIPLLQAALPAVAVEVLPAPVVAAGQPAVSAVTTPDAPPAAAESPAAPAPAAWTPPSAEAALAGIWLLGALALAGHLAAGVLRVTWLERRSSEVTDEGWVRLTDTLSRRLRLGRIVTLLRDERASVPMTWGVFRPVILLPGQAAEWTEERRTVVLAHELAHVRRWDALTQWVAHAAVVLHWYNPLVWTAARHLREERERACDDAVLAIGARPSAYADHLLTLVQAVRGEGPVAALAMARRSQFEGRLLAILDSANARRGASGLAVVCALALAGLATAPLAALRVTERPAREIAVRHDAPGSATGTPAPELPAPPGAPGIAAPAEARPAIAAAAGIESSSGRARALTGVLAQEPLTPDEAVALLEVVRGMSSGSGMREVLVAALGRVPLDDRRVRDAYFAAVDAIDSDAERGGVLSAMLRGRLDDTLLSAVFRATHGMSSDAERREVLVLAVKERRLNAATRADFTAALNTLKSDHERSAVLAQLLESGSASAPKAAPGVWSGTSVHRRLEDEVEQYTARIVVRGVRLSDARDDVAGIDPGGSLTLTETRPGAVSRSLTVLPGAGGLRFDYRVGGDPRPVDDSVRAWLRQRIREAKQ